MRAAIEAGRHVYCEKPITEDLELALALARLAEEAGVRHGVVQDKLFLPGMRTLKRVLDSGALGRVLSVRGEFGYWVFPGPDPPAQRPSWNYRAADGGGIVGDMFSHWRYVLDELFGAVRGVFALGATHVPLRYDEGGHAYEADAEDAAYAIFELEDGVIAQLNSSWCVRVDRGELFELQVDGTEGTAVAGLRECRIQPAAATPRAVWNPDLPDPVDHRAAWLPVPAQRVRQRVQGPVGALPAPRRARRAVPVGLPRGRARRAARRARHAVVARAALGRGAAAVTRVAFAAAHVAAGPTASIDWEATLDFRRHLWQHGLGVAEAMDTAQRGMGLDWPAARELIRRTRRRGAAAGWPPAAGTDHAEPRTLDEVRAAYEHQCEFVEGTGAQVDRDGEPRAGRRRASARRLPRGLRRRACASSSARRSCTGSATCSTPRWPDTGARRTSTRRPRPCSTIVADARRQGRRRQGLAARRRARGRASASGCRRACASTPATTSTTPS